MTESQYYREMRKGGLGKEVKRLQELEAKVKRLQAAVDAAYCVMLYRGWHTLARPSIEADAWDLVEASFRDA